MTFGRRGVPGAEELLEGPAEEDIVKKGRWCFQGNAEYGDSLGAGSGPNTWLSILQDRVKPGIVEMIMSCKTKPARPQGLDPSNSRGREPSYSFTLLIAKGGKNKSDS